MTTINDSHTGNASSELTQDEYFAKKRREGFWLISFFLIAVALVVNTYLLFKDSFAFYTENTVLSVTEAPGQWMAVLESTNLLGAVGGYYVVFFVLAALSALVFRSMAKSGSVEYGTFFISLVATICVLIIAVPTYAIIPYSAKSSGQNEVAAEYVAGEAGFSEFSYSNDRDGNGFALNGDGNGYHFTKITVGDVSFYNLDQ